MNSRILLFGLITIFVIMASLWLGVGVATDQFRTILIGASVIGAIVCLMLGQRVWILLFVCNAINVPIIRGFQSQEMGQFILIGISALLFLMRRLKADWKLTEMDFWRFLIGLMILQVYLRYPAGLNMFGASVMGGRPYFVAVPALLTGYLLARYKVPAVEIKWAFWASMLGAILGEPARRFRGGGGTLGLGGQTASAGGIQLQDATRDSGFNAPAEFLAKFVTSRVSPLRSCLNPIWAFLILLSMAFAAMSGYRNVIALVGIIYIIGVIYRGGFFDFVISIMLAGLLLLSLNIYNEISPLPANIQRALSPFPGNWDERYVADAERSTEWRTIMWQEALTTDKYIKNKIIGDGLGLTREQHKRLEYLGSLPEGDKDRTGLTIQQESMMLVGGYHSFPVETIRAIGYLGLLIMTIAMIRLLFHAHQQILRCKGTEWFTPVLFLLIPVMAYPFYYYLIFGTFKDGIAFFFIQSGLVDLIKRNLPLPHYQPKTKSIARPLGWRGTPSTDPAKMLGR
jgi:hypothetical protein